MLPIAAFLWIDVVISVAVATAILLEMPFGFIFLQPSLTSAGAVHSGQGHALFHQIPAVTAAVVSVG